MPDHALPDCLAEGQVAALPLYLVTPAGLDRLRGALPAAAVAWLGAQGFAARPQELVLLPGPEGLAGAALGLGAEPAWESPWSFGTLPYGLPAGTTWRPDATHAGNGAGSGYEPGVLALGWCLGAYRFTRFKGEAAPDGAARRAPARLVPPAGTEAALRQAAAICRGRDLINTPANALGPAELVDAVSVVADAHGATFERIAGEALREGYPALAAVGAGSPRAPEVAILRWQPPDHADAASLPLLALCGKGVCFDTGGLDLKPSSAMLRMKKDMGGAASMLALAESVMAERLPVRLLLLVGAVENAVSGTAMRPLDVLRTRAGLTIEVGNTDAEGRIVLADLLARAAEERPALILDAATLTGAARVALGPDLPALFANDDVLARTLFDAAGTAADPLWRLPLHAGYASWLESTVADLNTVATRPMAGAIVAALFLQRFVPSGMRWAHIDTYCWNDGSRPGRPEGGEIPAVRGLLAGIRRILAE
ncbi:leucyl aminopeptidase family protein [Roseomonas sp. NAR14]|uniref:Leucyl aminopeptidase family protein n=1 Tax=Roseomonas acroporae TaxID=2937791 RepID=A0A9X2BUU9_9PROT|nr:leucyl aminopeptidase family protein [Roseomonas acroporae]MCK8784466.1 leucyl aminopeptidase family protein [Roseomonas acroporae]